MDELKYEALTGNKLETQRDNWRTLCPVHSESRPSFFIHKETYLCHCFGCGVKGYLDNVLSRALEIDATTIRTVLGLPNVVDRSPMAHKEEAPFSRAWLEAFPRIYMHPYLRKRGFKGDVVLLHQTRWDEEEARIVFPLSSLGGPPMGATGRATKPDAKKWYHYWNASVGSCLYQPVDTLAVNIIVEGIFDCMWLNQHGYPGTVALLGSHASKKQVQLIKDNTDEVLLFLDNDEAGRRGAHDLARELRSSVKVRFAKYPEEGTDPQELKEYELHQAINESMNYVEYFRGQ